MSLDLLGPANSPNAVTVRPADTRVFGGNDTFFEDCSAPGAGDGTKVQAGFLNGLLQQVRRAIRGMGVTENNGDDDMLLKAIKASASAIAASSGYFGNRQTYAAAGSYTWTVPTGVTKVRVRVWGAGGGGGGAGPNGFSAAGGNGGGYAEKLLAVTPGANLAVVVGAHGLGGTGNVSGTSGGQSSFAYPALYADGGPAGGWASATTLPDNTASTATGHGGDINLAGGRGESGRGPANTEGAIGGKGGAAAWGGDGAPGRKGDGNAGTAPGGGGSGAGGFTGGNSIAGDGADGMVIIEWNDPV
jgi:hypothetical protein